MKIRWESLSDQLLFDHVETECGNRKVFKRLSFYFHLGGFDYKGEFFIFICILTLFFRFYSYFYSNLRASSPSVCTWVGIVYFISKGSGFN